MKRPPWWEKQKEALQFAKKRADEGKGVALFAACGTGKTRVAINWLQHLFVHKDVKLVYIVAPIAVLPVWIDNWYDWATAPVAFIDLHETGSAGLRKAQELASVSDFPVICLVNYEAAWQIGHKRIEHMRNGEPVKTLDKVDTTMNDLNWDAGILDEVTAIKTPGSKVSKFFRRKMAPRTTYKMVLTGSAYTKRPLDVWAPVNYACGDEVFSKAFLPFKTEYAIPHPYIRGAVIGYRNLEDLVLRLSKVAVMLKKEDMFDLPPFVHETRIIELSPRSRKVYNDIRDEQVAEIEASEEEWKAFKAGKTDERPKTVTAEHIFTSIRKLSQITGGFVYPDPDEDTPDIKPTPVRLGTEKLSVLLDILEDRDSPTIVVTQTNEEEKIIAEAVTKKFGFVPKILNGSVKGSMARHDMIKQAANDLCFIVKERVGARGVDMRYADMTIFYGHSYDSECYEQILSRNHRGGQTKNITYMHLICKDTIDVRIMNVLRRDLKLAASIEHDWRKLF